MTTVNLAFSNFDPAVTGWNTVLGADSTGQKVADLLDSTGASTGLSLWVTTAFAGQISSLSLATADAHGIPEEALEQYWYAGNGPAFEIRGFAPGQSGSISLLGDGGDASRDSDYIINGGSPVRYDANGGEPFNAPVSIPFTADEAGVVEVSGAPVNTYWYINAAVVDYSAETAPSITTADDVTTEGQTATFTLANNAAAPTSATLNGTDVGAITLVSGSTYSYTAPLIADDATADLVVSVDGTTASTTIAYANSYGRDQLTHPATAAEYSENSLSYPNAYATTQPYEWKVITGASASVVIIDWDALELDDGFFKDIANYATPVANGSTTVTLGVFVPETGQAYQFDRTITVSDGSVVVSSEDGAVGAALTPAISDAIEDAIA